jgi:uncharacterized BrkB/YihY/UPF0761 family membrane protein
MQKVKHHISSFRKEFNKHMAAFITGAFAFVAALLWRDAIQNSLDQIKDMIPDIGVLADYLTALVITIVAVIAIVFISRILKTK